LDERNFEEDKTVHWKITSVWGGKKVELRETPRAVTPFGGLVVFFEFLRQVGYCEAVKQHLPFRLTSPNAIDPVETFTVFLLSVVAGARRFAHTSLLRADVALHELLGITRFPVDDTIRNLFKRFGQGQCQRFFSGLWNWQLERLPECSCGYSLDLDSTVFERYGRQQGAFGGAQPAQAWTALASSLGGGAGRSAFSVARLAAQRQLRLGPWRCGISQGGAGAVAGKTCDSRGARRCGLF
jgi:hypothetical protein